MKTYSIFSLGLIGGSIARAIRSYVPDAKINIYARREETIGEAIAAGVCDYGTTVITKELCEADMIFLCAPVSVNVALLKEMKPFLKKSTIITDVGSVKTDIHLAVNELGLSSQFIGGHPMAGSEKTGFSNSSERILENAYYILTPGERVPQNAVSEYEALVSKLTAIPVVLSYEEHDYATAGISHLPHIIAYSLVNLVKEKDNDKQLMKMLAAGGFRDITRIASSSPEMWEQICFTNQKNILSLLDDYKEMLDRMKAHILSGEGNALNQEFRSAKDYRDNLIGQTHSAYKQSFFFHLDIADVPGAIAHVSTLLAEETISIKNIGIVHNREFEEGALRVEFYDNESMKRAKGVVESHDIRVFPAK